jgi:hypothetical protein
MSVTSQFLSRLRIPSGRTRALGLLVLFALVQVADAWLTVVGVNRYGVGAEANPLLALPIVLFGPAAALTVAKSLAVFGATVLYSLSRHFLLAMLTLTYVVVAVMPWALALGMA